jgi:tetratricopeptide (TPR) repeat protein
MRYRSFLTLKNPAWIIILIISLGLLQCRNFSTPPPTETPIEGRVSHLQTDYTNLKVGEQVKVRVDVVKIVGDPTLFEYQWATTGGLVATGQGTCCITYHAPNTPGAFQIQLTVKYGQQFVQRSLTFNVIAPTPTPTPTVPPGTPTVTPTPTESPLPNAVAYFNRAQENYVRRDYERAIADYTKAIELNYEPLSEAYYQRGSVQYNEQNYRPAIDDFSQAIQLSYEPLGLVFYNRGNAYYYKGDNELAIADYTKAIELGHEPLSWLYNNRGLALRKQGQYEAAIADYTQAIELGHQPLHWPYYNRGNAYTDLGDYDKAITDYNQAINLDPANADAYYQRGQAYKKSGNPNNAIADFKKVLELGSETWRDEAEKELQGLGSP